LVCTDEDTAIAVDITPGQAGDAPEFDAMFVKARARVPDAEQVVADKAYDSWEIKGQVLEAEMSAEIPSKSNAMEPWTVDPDAYAARNKIERLFNKLKQFRAIATRYDKLKVSFLANIKLVLSFIRIRSIVNRT
jgi:transposase